MASVLRHRSPDPVASAFVLSHRGPDSDAGGRAVPRRWVVLSVVVNDSLVLADEVSPEPL
jgi:hypothetical protein